jgi:TolB-like protein
MPPEALDRETARNGLEILLHSPGFKRNERLSQFLRLVVERHLEGRDEELKESIIAMEVFGRKADYDPKLDSIVRTEASRLRAKLAEYYVNEGKNDRVIIELPKGGYVPVIRFVPQAEAPPLVKPPHRQRSLWFAGVAVILIFAALAAVWLFRIRATPGPISIAVLPLQNLNRDGGSDDFADGLTDEIIRNLSVIEGLAVRSRTSSFAFKDQPRNIREVGQQLQANYVIEGSVLRAGEKLRVNVQLVRVQDDSPVWSGRFDRLFTDILAIQDEISTGVVNELRLNLGRGRRRYEINADAYDLYLRGRALTTRRGFKNLQTAIDLFNRAIERDSKFAPAFAGLADAYARLSVNLAMEPGEADPKMRIAAETAIQLDPLLAEANSALGVAYARAHEWDSAEKSFRRAIELDPNQSARYVDYAFEVLLSRGRVDEAVTQLRLALKTDPLSPDVHRMLAFALISKNDYEQAAAHCQTALSLQPDYPFVRQFLGRARAGQERWQEAFELLAAPGDQGFLGYAYARGGRITEAQQLAAANGGRPNRLVLIYAGLGDRDRTFEAFHQMIAGGDARVPLYLNFPELDLIRDDPRLPALRQQIGLPK